MIKLTIDYNVLELFKPWLLGFCNCGCGEPLNRLVNKQGKIIKYIQYHNIKELRYYGSDNNNFSGYRKRGGHGNKYWKLFRPDHPTSDKFGFIYEHRFVMEQHLGRLLDPNEVVHHINGVKDDNRIENLELIKDNPKHISTHHKHVESDRHCFDCGTYETWVNKKGWPVWTRIENNWYCRKCGRKKLWALEKRN